VSIVLKYFSANFHRLDGHWNICTVEINHRVAEVMGAFDNAGHEEDQLRDQSEDVIQVRNRIVLHQTLEGH